MTNHPNRSKTGMRLTIQLSDRERVRHVTVDNHQHIHGAVDEVIGARLRSSHQVERNGDNTAFIYSCLLNDGANIRAYVSVE